MNKQYELKKLDKSSLWSITSFLETSGYKNDFYQFIKDELNIKEQIANPRLLGELLYDKYKINIDSELDITNLYFFDKDIIKNRVYNDITLDDWIKESIPLDFMVSNEKIKEYYYKEYRNKYDDLINWRELEKLPPEQMYNELNEIIPDYWSTNIDWTTSTQLQYDVNKFKEDRNLSLKDVEKIKRISKIILKERRHTIFVITKDLEVLSQLDNSIVLELFPKFVLKNQKMIDLYLKQHENLFVDNLFIKQNQTRLL